MYLASLSMSRTCNSEIPPHSARCLPCPGLQDGAAEHTAQSPHLAQTLRLLVRHLQGVWPGGLQGSAPPGQGLCRNGISEHTGRTT